MIFTDEIFRFMQFEETLMFASLDIDLNSFSAESMPALEVTEEHLEKICQENLAVAFSCDREQLQPTTNPKKSSHPPTGPPEEKSLTPHEIECLIDKVMF